MFRVFRKILVELFLLLVADSISTSNDAINNSDIKIIEEKAEQYTYTPYEFVLEDLNTLFRGTYDGESAALKFSKTTFSSKKDTIFFDYSIFFQNKHQYIDINQGNGFIISKKEIIILYQEKQDQVLEGSAIKIYNEEVGNESNEGYLFLVINDKGKKLNFIDKQIKYELKK